MLDFKDGGKIGKEGPRDLLQQITNQTVLLQQIINQTALDIAAGDRQSNTKASVKGPRLHHPADTGLSGNTAMTAFLTDLNPL